jgi:O-antigen/teichoic acid export membrane protein
MSALTQAQWGSYAITTAALLYHKKTGVQALLELGAGMLCVLINLLLIPACGKEGAALATLLSFLTLNLASARIGRSLLYIPYETTRIMKILVAVFFCAACSYVPIQHAISYCSAMYITFTLFFFYAWHSILNAEERTKIKYFLYRSLKIETA